MARFFLMNMVLEEAYKEDLLQRKRQAKKIRKHTILDLLYREYIYNYRLSEEMIENLKEEIQPLLKSRHRRDGIRNKVKLLCTLSFFATGSYQRICGYNINNFMSQPTASRCLHEIVDVLCHPNIRNKYIRFPANFQERLKLKERFFEKYNIPGCVGCVDGTFVTMIRPKENEHFYYCRKGNHARNVQLYTDADLNILYVDASYGGATHDSFVFSYGEIRYHLEELVNAGESVYLLGDSGYAQRPYLMVPVPNPEPGSAEEHYNKLHASARNSVERAIGLLKARFRCLLVHRALHYDPTMVGKIVIACCVLHNICNRAGLPAPILESEQQQHEAQFRATARGRSSNLDTEPADFALGLSSRQRLINDLWRARP